MKTPQYIIISLVVILMASFAISTSAQSLPTVTMDKPIQDMTISELQAKIAEILSVIQQLQALIAQLQPGGGGVSCNFYRNLYPGISGSDVKCLQEYLNNAGHTVANSGPGSSNNETIYYGSLTRAAVKKWQDANHIESGAWWGYFGPKSQAIYNEIAAIGEQEEPPTPPSGTYCGDNIAQRPSDQGTIEDCDGTDLRNKTCLTQGYTGGTLLCSNDCSFNTSQCTGTGPTPTPPTPGPTTSCGDSIMQKPNSKGIYEVCDSTNLGISTCLTYGYPGGTLSCSSNCITFNTTNCLTALGGGGGGAPEPEPEPDPGPVCGDTDGICPSGCTYSQDTDCTYCGDSIIQSPNDEGISEVCDGTSLSGETCITKGFPGGTLQCSSTCLTFDTSSCSLPSPPNQAPVLNPIGNKTTSENQQLSFTVSATDPDGDDLSYSISDIPTGAIFNASTRTFTWTPTYDQQGTYTPTFTVSDGSLTDTETITITVSNVNRAPVLSPIGNKTVDENQTLTFTVSGTDIDEDTLYYSILDSPSGASFDSSTGTFTWTPTYEQQGTYTPTFIVSDSEYTDQETITITVNNIETGPVCGDSICEGTETCSTCEADCGECPAGFPTDHVAYWRFDSETGGVTPDESIYNNDGTLMDNAAIISDAERGNVLSLDGSGDYVSVADNVAFDGKRTISFWFWRTGGYSAGQGDENLFSHRRATGTTPGIRFFLKTDGIAQGRLRTESDPGAAGTTILDSTITSWEDRWYYIAVVADDTNMTLYIDGVYNNSTAFATAFADADALLYLGADRNVANTLTGIIDEVTVWNRALTQTEIQQIMNIGTECSLDSDCNDNNDCTINTCVGAGGASADSRGCAVSFFDNGTVCDDDLFCTTAGTSTCDGAGSCGGGTLEDCSETPDIACTDDVCVEGPSSCVHQNTANDSNCPGQICDVLLGCVADPCDGINVCGDYIGETECNADTCVPGGCLWNSGLDVCEEALTLGYEGFGAVTRGALDAPGGYETYHVTSLTDSGAGTLRDAVSQGSRYIVFDVGGTITVTNDLPIRYSYITIDGSSAPSPGITISQPGNSITEIEPWSGQEAHDIIVHHLRFIGPGSGGDQDILGLNGMNAHIYNVIIDHITATASGDGTFDIIVDVQNVTLSWNFVYNTELTTLVKYGGIEGISFHHNVYAKNAERQALVGQDIQLMDYVNNVVYGWDFKGGLRIVYNASGPSPNLNVENNVFHLWENGFYDMPEHAILFDGGQDADSVYFFNGNIIPVGETDAVSTGPRLPIPAYAQVTMYEASTLGDTVVPYVGTHYPTQEEQALLSEISIALGASEARISQTDDTIDEKINNLASVLSSIQSAVQDILEKIKNLF